MPRFVNGYHPVSNIYLPEVFKPSHFRTVFVGIDGGTPRHHGSQRMPPRESARTRWCFTINNPEDGIAEQLSGLYPTHCRFICFELETGAEGTRHYQGYMELATRRRLSGVKQLPGLERCHLEAARGTAAQNTTYCSKEGTPTILGTPADGPAATAGVYADAIESARAGEFDNIDPSVYVRCYTTLHRIHRDYAWQLAQAQQEYPVLALFRWQAQVLDFLNAPVCPRTIFFVIDNKGGAGKSTFGSWLRGALPDPPLCLGPGSHRDLAQLVRRPPRVVLYDIPRGSIQHVSWSLMEELKNGYVICTKYEGGVLEFPRPHVIVFCNEDFPTNVLSEDRIKAIYL